jgi:hypothetical protein
MKRHSVLIAICLIWVIVFEDNASFTRLWTGASRVYLWTEEDRRDGVFSAIDAGTVYELARGGGTVILTNRAPD